jgi:hypothetical protein
MTAAVSCEYCGEERGEEFADETDLAFHWYCQHLTDLTDEEFRAASNEYDARLLDSVNVDVDVTIPRGTWEDVVALETDGADPEDVTPADVDEDAMMDLVDPEFHYRVEGRDSRD